MQKQHAIQLVKDTRTNHVILISKSAPENEQRAAKELALFLKQSTNASFPIVNKANPERQPIIAVGSEAAKLIDPSIQLKNLGRDGIVIRTFPPHLILTGGEQAPRGTLYAVYKFLEDAVGCHWWTPSVSYIPSRTNLVIHPLRIRYKPILEYRNVHAFKLFNQPDWAVRNMLVGNRYALDEKRGGFVGYTKKPYFVHTFNRIVPPKKYFPLHPEWFSKINGERLGGDDSQLCLTNSDLLKFVTKRVKEYLRASPPESILSVSQNDNNHKCKCEHCRAIENIEGSPSGPLLRFVNAVADAVRDEFPLAKIDTLAYRYTQKPPKITTPRSNVVVRLCSYLNSYDKPMEAPINKQFSDDIRAWSKISKKLYIWDYITNFRHYLRPYPNKRVLGSHIRFLVKHGACGIFEQSNYQSPGGEFANLKAWVLAKLLWDPNLNDRKLIRQFVKGYYHSAAPYIIEYIDLLEDAAATGKSYKFCLLTAESLFIKAEESVKQNPEFLRRVQLAHVSVYYGIITNYPFCDKQNKIKGSKHIKLLSLDQYLGRFLKICKENKITRISEHRIKGTISFFKHRTHLKAKQKAPATPSLCGNAHPDDWFEFYEDSFKIARGELRKDEAASTNLAVRMTAEKTSWATQLSMPAVNTWVADGLLKKKDAKAIWDVYAAVRVERKKRGDGVAFAYGIYDTRTKEHVSEGKVSLSNIKSDDYQFYKVGSTPIVEKRYIWVGPVKNDANVKAIWVDRIVFVKKKK